MLNDELVLRVLDRHLDKERVLEQQEDLHVVACNRWPLLAEPVHVQRQHVGHWDGAAVCNNSDSRKSETSSLVLSTPVLTVVPG